MSLLFLAVFLVAIIRSKLYEIADEMLYSWALFAIADALWAGVVLRLVGHG